MASSVGIETECLQIVSNIYLVYTFLYKTPFGESLSKSIDRARDSRYILVFVFYLHE